MSPKAFVRSAVSAIVLVVAACGDATRITAPATSLALKTDAPARVVSCDVSWINAAGGAWSTATNWSTGIVPNATQNVCITLDGSYTVMVYGAVTANTITIGATNNTGLVIVNVQVGGGSSTLTGVNGIVNHGVIYLTGGITANIYAAALAVTNGELVNNGSIGVYPDGVGAQRIIAANLVNNGLVSVHTTLQLNKAGAVFENRGTFTLENSRHVFVAGGIGQTFRQSAGTLTIPASASLNVNKETFDFAGGTIVGAPIITNGKLTIADGNQDAGSFIVRGQTTFAGNIAAAQAVYIQAYGTAATMTSATGFTNAGTLEFTYTFGTTDNQMYSALTITDGALTNTGLLRLAPHFSWSQISADVVNLGTMSVEDIVNFTKVGGVFENRGTISASAFNTHLVVAANTNQTFRQVAGTIALTNGATMTMNGGTFEAIGGTITGRPQLDNSVLRFAAECSGSGAVAIRGASSTLQGDVPADWTVHVNSGGAAFAQLTSAGSFTNRGTIELARGVGGDNTNTTMLTVTDGVFTNEGTLATVPDPHGANRTINANVINNGTVSVQTTMSLARQNGTFVNNGTMAFGANRLLTANGMAQTFTTTGPITGTGRIDFKDITMNASGNIAANLTLTNTALHIAGSALGTLNLTGTYTQFTTASVNVQLRDGTPGGYDRFNIIGTATLGLFSNTATLNVTPFDGACIEPNQTFDIMTYTSRGGDFLVKNGLNLGGGRTLAVSAGATVYKLTSAGPACPVPDNTAPMIAPTVTGTPGNNGWYVSDVAVTWSVTDAESPVTSSTGCDDVALTTDSNGETYTCSATSDGGSASQSVTIKRDATPPVVTTSQSPMPNANGWNNTDVTAFWSGSDAMSGLEGAANRQSVFNGEGIQMNFGGRYFDKAGNKTEVLIYASIDRKPPVVSATRAPSANANGWNNTDVTAMYSATDGLSGIDGSASATRTFSAEGANQDGSYQFTDRAGNTATADVGGVSIDKTNPVVTVSRSPAPDATGWNNTNVTATWNATDALSGIAGSSTATMLFDQDGANQSASRTFTDLADNSASATISGINIDKTPIPPPPPPTMTPACSVTPSDIWAPNNKMVAVRVTVGGTGVTSYRLRSVSNNETGSSDVDGWTIGTADVDGSVKATRLGGGSGRTYTLTYDVFGAGGATGSCAVTVRVPHDQRR